MDQTTLVLGGLLAVVGGVLLLYGALVFWSPSPIVTHASERMYRSHSSPTTSLPLPRLEDPSTVDLTIVVPAYNETQRLSLMMEATIKHLTSPSLKGVRSGIPGRSVGNGSGNGDGDVDSGAAHRRSNGGRRSSNNNGKTGKRTFEIIIIDDASTDGTSALALELAAKYADCDIKVVTLEKNLGKGGGVRHGMLYAGGARLLMADADGASRIEDLEALWACMDALSGDDDDAPAVVVGSRAHLVKTEAVVKRSLLRNILMYGLHTILRIVGVGHIRDTQCGFKLFSRSAAQQIFPAQHLPTWIFDVELLLLAKQLRIPVAEVPIEWHEVAGSKLNVFTASLQMLRDLFIVRANHLTGRWTAGQRAAARKSKSQ